MPIAVVELPGSEWTDLPITVEFAGALTPEQRIAFEAVVSRWYDDGTHGAFGGPLHSMDPVGFHAHDDSSQTAEWIVDMGDADQRAIDSLSERVEQFGAGLGTTPIRIVLGWIDVD